MPISFVKFQRGSQAAYDALKRSGRLEDDALYFIYNDPTDASLGGQLYLGERLIGGASSGSTVTQLSDLTDIDVSNISSVAEPDGMILQYNALAQVWEAVSVRDAIEDSGANIGGPDVSSTTASQEQTPEQAAAAADATPHEGDIVFVDGVPYIYNGSTWQKLTGDSLDSTISDISSRLSAVESGLQAVDGKISTAVANAQHLKYVVPQDGILPVISTAQPGSLDNTIFLIPNSTADLNDNYDEYMFIKTSDSDPGSFEKLGNWGVDLNGYVTTATFETRVGSLETAVAGLQANTANYVLTTRYESEVGNIASLRTATGDNSSTVVGELLSMRERLQWNELDGQP